MKNSEIQIGAELSINVDARSQMAMDAQPHTASPTAKEQEVHCIRTAADVPPTVPNATCFSPPEHSDYYMNHMLEQPDVQSTHTGYLLFRMILTINRGYYLKQY
jgi:hypothetical protein